jgi:hypothetical protein
VLVGEILRMLFEGSLDPYNGMEADGALECFRCRYRIVLADVVSIHPPPGYFVGELIGTARKQNCGTIAVGRESYSSFKEMFHHHVGEELVRQAPGFAVRVIA